MESIGTIDFWCSWGLSGDGGWWERMSRREGGDVVVGGDAVTGWG